MSLRPYVPAPFCLRPFVCALLSAPFCLRPYVVDRGQWTLYMTYIVVRYVKADM